MVSATMDRISKPIAANRDLFLVVAIIGILISILLPMPGQIMDAALALNIGFSLLVLITAIYVRSPLDFSVFPSLLLVMTLYRLALNIATTRLILGNSGDQGDLAAGTVIRVFGTTVTAGNTVVGFVIFAVIVIIQFVVITKGATRIAEVAARFTLDKMPGQQLSIDADLNAGLIDEETAKKRRERIAAEADFYGAMDGASKFVRGDAIAGILITLINIVGGLAIGVLSYGMSVTEAASLFTRLTIGDGLVSQVPALLVSVAAALIVTRQSTESNLGVDLIGQLFSSPRAVAITATFLVLLIGLGLPPIVLLFFASILGVVSFMMSRSAQEAAELEAEEDEVDEESAGPREVAVAPVDPLELEVGYGLINLVESGESGGLLRRIGLIREQLASELGTVIPSVRIRDNMQFHANDYAVKLRGETVAHGTVVPDEYLAMDSGLGLDPIEGTKTKEPAFGIDAIWIREENKGRAEAMGYTVVDPVSVMATHLTEVVREHASELLTREETHRLVEKVKENAASVVEELIPDVLKMGDVQKVLQGLLKEKVSIRDLETILETLADWGPRSRDPEVLIEYVRNGLSRSIVAPYTDPEGALHVITLDPRVEEYIAGAIEHNERGSVLRLGPESTRPIIESVGRTLESLVRIGHPPLVLTTPQIRSQVRRVLERSIAGVTVLSYNEAANYTVESHGVAKID